MIICYKKLTISWGRGLTTADHRHMFLVDVINLLWALSNRLTLWFFTILFARTTPEPCVRVVNPGTNISKSVDFNLGVLDHPFLPLINVAPFDFFVIRRHILYSDSGFFFFFNSIDIFNYHVWGVMVVFVTNGISFCQTSFSNSNLPFPSSFLSAYNARFHFFYLTLSIATLESEKWIVVEWPWYLVNIGLTRKRYLLSCSLFFFFFTRLYVTSFRLTCHFVAGYHSHAQATLFLLTFWLVIKFKKISTVHGATWPRIRNNRTVRYFILLSFPLLYFADCLFDKWSTTSTTSLLP